MTLYIYTPETLKKEIDLLVKTKGFKFFILSSDKDGTAHAPSIKKPLYRIPVSVYNIFKPGKTYLSKMVTGFYMVGFVDETDFDEEAMKEVQKALERNPKEIK